MDLSLYIGLDPGLRGAFAVLDSINRHLIVHDIPTTTKKNGRDDVDPYELAALTEKYARRVRYAIVEDVNAMVYTNAQGERRGQGAAHSFAFGKAFGVAIGVLGAFYIPIIPVKPAVWKTLMGLSSDKNRSRAKASEMFPLNISDFARKKDDGRAEAALLAHFGADRFKT